MRRIPSFVAMLAVSSSVLSGCATPPGGAGQASGNSCAILGPKSLTGIGGGALAGAGAGALLAPKDRAKGALIGALVGAIAGAMIGKSLDNKDCEAAKLALRRLDTTPTGSQIAWANPDSGTRGTFTPTADATIGSNGRSCRPVQRDVTFKDGTQTAGDTGIVCRTPNGDYESMS